MEELKLISMRQSVTMKIAMYESVLATLKGKQSLLDLSPALTNAVDKFEADVVNFKGVAYAQSDDLTWITAKKHFLADKMLTKAIRMNKVLVAYAVNNGLNDIVERFNYSPTSFMKGGIQGKVMRVNNLIQVISEYIPELAPYNISQGDLEELVFSFNELDSFVRAPRVASTERSVLTNTLTESIRKIDHHLNFVLDAIMLRLEEMDHESYLHYVKARKLVRSTNKHRDSGA